MNLPCLPSHWANQTTSLSLSFSFWVWPEFWGGRCEWCADPAPRAGRQGRRHLVGQSSRIEEVGPC